MPASEYQHQEHCPCCGRFPSEDDGYYMFIAEAPDFVSLFCNQDCARRYQMKGGKIIDGDGEPYTPDWTA